VVGLGGLELPTKRLSVASSEQPPSIAGSRMAWASLASPTCPWNGADSTRCSAFRAGIARILEQSLWVVASVRGNGSFAPETPPKPFSLRFNWPSLQAGHGQCSEVAADNRLVASSSPPSLRWRLITAWLEVRALPAPPRSPIQTEISRCRATSGLNSVYLS
jgi:hypothetical protein